MMAMGEPGLRMDAATYLLFERHCPGQARAMGRRGLRDGRRSTTRGVDSQTLSRPRRASRATASPQVAVHEAHLGSRLALVEQQVAGRAQIGDGLLGARQGNGGQVVVELEQ